jgi:hypothetical protein
MEGANLVLRSFAFRITHTKKLIIAPTNSSFISRYFEAQRYHHSRDSGNAQASLHQKHNDQSRSRTLTSYRCDAYNAFDIAMIERGLIGGIQSPPKSRPMMIFNQIDATFESVNSR